MHDETRDELEGLSGQELGAAILERARKALPRQSLRPVRIDALDATVWVKPVTLATRDRLTRRAMRKGALDEGKYGALIVIHHTFSEDGKPLYNEGDLRALYAGDQPNDWVVELAREIVSGGLDSLDDLTIEDEAAEDVAGNSSTPRLAEI